MELYKLAVVKLKITYLTLVLFLYGCANSGQKPAPSQKRAAIQIATDNAIACSDKSCVGSYVGPEFVDRDDVAHQFSNQMSSAVGDQLKKLYKKGTFSKVDFSAITMNTTGMGTGYVNYTLGIPFVSVSEACDAYTSFDHVGGWNHAPALSARKKQLSKVLLKGESLEISDLKTTPEGLQEYWIQWKNKDIQADCEL